MNIKNTLNLNFEECISELPREHKIKLRWFHENKNLVIPWTLIHTNNLAIIPKGIYKPKGWKFALSAKTTLAEIYDDGEIEFDDDLSWEVDYCPERPKDGSYAYTNEALKACHLSKVPIGYLIQVKRKPSSYRVMGPAIVQFDSNKDMFHLIGSSEDGLFKIF